MAAVEVGQTLAGKLVIEGVLGQGGMGVVLVARHAILNERVAVKLLRPVDPSAPNAAPHDPTHVERLHREARAAARLKGIHVSRVMDVGTLDDGSPYIVMEYIDGATLAATVRERGPLPVEEVVDYVLQTCEGLAEAHVQGIVHRDLKPSNLMLTRGVDGSALVKILDFGIARASDGHQPTLTGSSVMLGSPSYMSPEQIRDAHDVDVRTDLWSLGVTFYELLTQHLPFEAFTPAGLIARISVDPPVPPSAHVDGLPDGLEDVVLRCLEKSPDARFGSVAELAQALVPFASPRGVLTAERIERVILATYPDLPRVTAGPAPRPRTTPSLSSPRRFQPEAETSDVPPRSARSAGVASGQTASEAAHTISADGTRPVPLAGAAATPSTPPAPRRLPVLVLVGALLVGLPLTWFLVRPPSPPAGNDARAVVPTISSTTAATATTATTPTPTPTPTPTTAPTPSATVTSTAISAAMPVVVVPRASATAAAGGQSTGPKASARPAETRTPPSFVTDFGDRK